MIRGSNIIRRGAVDTNRVVDVITLDHDERHRRRTLLTADGGTVFLLDLGKADVLHDGDAIELETGWLVEIRASAERLVEIRADTPLDLLVLAWHIGNRHVPAEVTPDALYILHDHVLIEMLNAQGASTMVVERPFNPVRGAYHHHGSDAGAHSGHAHD